MWAPGRDTGVNGGAGITALPWAQGFTSKRPCRARLRMTPGASGPVPLLGQAFTVSSSGLIGRGCYYPHFADEENEAQRRGGLAQGHTRQWSRTQSQKCYCGAHVLGLGGLAGVGVGREGTHLSGAFLSARCWDGHVSNFRTYDDPLQFCFS